MHQWRFIKKSTHYGLDLPHRPAVVAALVSGLVSIVGFMVSARTNLSIHSQRLVFDENQAERKFDFDKELAERRLAMTVSSPSASSRRNASRLSTSVGLSLQKAFWPTPIDFKVSSVQHVTAGLSARRDGQGSRRTKSLRK